MKNLEQTSGFAWLVVTWTGMLLISGILVLGETTALFRPRQVTDSWDRPILMTMNLASAGLILFGIGFSRLLRLKRLKRLSLDRVSIIIALLIASLLLAVVFLIMWGYEISLQGEKPVVLWGGLVFWNLLFFLGILVYLASRDREDVRIKFRRFSRLTFTEDNIRLMSLALIWMGASTILGILLLFELKLFMFGVTGLPHETRKYVLIVSFSLIVAGGIVMAGLSMWEKRWFDRKKILPAIIAASIILAATCFVFWLANILRAYNPGVEWPSGPDNFLLCDCKGCGTCFVNKEQKIIGAATRRYVFWFRLLLWNLAILATSLYIRFLIRRWRGKAAQGMSEQNACESGK